ncbi:MAG: radical SAM family heme chaperone HemW [Balneola sp.]
MSSLYLHIPFCKQACSYCDFYFVTRQDHKQHFVDALIKEILFRKDSVFAEESIQTIYFGGGTPSLLSAKQVEAILEAISDTFKLDVQEVTLEMNPDDVSPNYLSELKSVGITRASMGVQSFDEKLLQFMNRAHTKEEALACLEALSTSGFKSFTVDLIYGNPNQTLEMLDKDISILLEFNPTHISAYSLTIEPKTRLGKQLELGRIVEPDDELVASHFDLVEERLGEAGIKQYEVSNFAKPGFEAVHNSNYWSHENYLGFGPGAHSFRWSQDKSKAERWNNKADLKGYIGGRWEFRNETEQLSLKELAEERLMLGLRTVKGLDRNELNERYQFMFKEKQLSYLHQKEKEGKVLISNSRIALTKEGLKISDAILLDLIT